MFNDVTLREMARHRPADAQTLRALHGVGDNKLKEFGRDFLQAIAAYCRDHGLPLSAAGPQAKSAPVSPPVPEKMTRVREQAFAMFREGDLVEEVMHVLGRSRPTVLDYLCDYLRREGVGDAAPWLSPDVLDQVRQAAAQVGSERLKPIFEALGGQVSYDEIRVAVAFLEARRG